MERRYRLSMYSYPFESEGVRYIYSTVTGSIIEVSERLWKYISSKELHHEEITGNNTLQKLAKGNIITTKEDDELLLNKIRLQYFSKAYQSSHLSLTLLPTELCNLKCFYCFEGEKNKVSMTEEVQESIVRFIERSKIKTFSITWFGGEPLLRPDIIESLLDKISQIEGKQLSHHSVITNGTLLNQKISEIFQKFPLNDMQITFDGGKRMHDSIRCYSDKRGTFDDIRKNVLEFIKKSPDTKLHFRVNINKDNQNDYLLIYKEISSWFKSFPEVKYNIYPGIIKDNGSASCSDICMDKHEQQDFYMSLKAEGINYYGFPQMKIGGCTATSLTSAVIGADGNVYRCWEDVGKSEKTVGNIVSKTTSNSSLFCCYMMNGNIYDDPFCQKCTFLPICGGGCPKVFMERNRNSKDIKSCNMYVVNEQKFLKKILKEEIEKIKGIFE